MCPPNLLCKTYVFFHKSTAADGNSTSKPKYEKAFVMFFPYRADACNSSIGLLVQSAPGVLQSPNYPFFYPTSTTCRWHLLAPPHRVVQLDISPHFQLEGAHNGTCIYDFVRLHDGGTPMAERLGTFCAKSVTNSSIRSSGRSMLVLFRSDESRSGRGFSARFAFGG